MESLSVLLKIIMGLALHFTVILGYVSIAVFIFLAVKEIVKNRNYKTLLQNIYWLNLGIICLVLPLLLGLIHKFSH
jgi:hypothetical protein